MKSSSNDPSEMIYNKIYFAKKKISSGSFGTVYLSENLQTNETVAIKIEKIIDSEMRSVLKESNFLEILKGIKGIPKVHWFGSKGDQDVLVLDLLSKDLATYLKIYKKFSIKTGLMLLDQALTILENIHNKNIVHRDIKPENMLMGREKESDTLFFVDFGISKIYKDNFGRHIPFCDKKSFIGTTRYASLAAHNGFEISRKDDLESLLYVFIYLINGELPWQNLNLKEDEKMKKICEIKTQISTAELCKGLPEEIYKCLTYIKSLGFRDSPDYNYLKGLAMKAIVNNKYFIDFKFDWTVDHKDKKENIKEENKNNEKKKIEKVNIVITKKETMKKKKENFELPKSSENININDDKLMVKKLLVPDLSKENSSYAASSYRGSSVAIKYENTARDWNNINSLVEEENDEFKGYNLQKLVSKLEESKVKSRFFKF